MLARLERYLSGSRFGPAEVGAVDRISPHMIRVTLVGELVKEFAADCAGGHLKLVVPVRDRSPEAFERLIESGNFKSAMRTYTIRHARPAAGEIDVDIAVHGDLGRVGPWARYAQAGDVIVISRCGTPKLITDGVTRILAAADMTGFPALAAGLETLGAGVRIDAAVEIPGMEDCQPVRLPDGVSIRWIVKADPHAPGTELIAAMRSAPVPDPHTSVFVAGEFTMVADLRAYFQKELGIDKTRLYISSYWKAGLDELAHKRVKAAAA